MNKKQTSFDIPKSISKSAVFIYISLIMGIINPIILELKTGAKNFSNPITLISILTSTGILAFLAYNINIGKNWARIIFTVLGIIGFLMFPFIIPDTFRLNFIVGVLSVLQAVLQLFAIILLFKPDARSWYRLKK